MTMSTELRDITKYPHATGKANVHGVGSESQVQHRAVSRALSNAVLTFKAKYNRNPDWDIIMFRGGSSSLTAVMEIWEEE